MIAAAILLSVTAPSQSCGLEAVTTTRAVHDALGHRAAEAIALASTKNSKADERLSAYVDRSAVFDLGAGDVGRPLGSGLVGIRALAEIMKADQFQFLGWDYMDGPSDPCGKQSITVDFINSTDHEMSQVEFAFDRGRIVAAKGWQRSLESGPLASRLPYWNGSFPPYVAACRDFRAKIMIRAEEPHVQSRSEYHHVWSVALRDAEWHHRSG